MKRKKIYTSTCNGETYHRTAYDMVGMYHSMGQIAIRNKDESLAQTYFQQEEHYRKIVQEEKPK